jgi:hypothetical protein
MGSEYTDEWNYLSIRYVLWQALYERCQTSGFTTSISQKQRQCAPKTEKGQLWLFGVFTAHRSVFSTRSMRHLW